MSFRCRRKRSTNADADVQGSKAEDVVGLNPLSIGCGDPIVTNQNCVWVTLVLANDGNDRLVILGMEEACWRVGYGTHKQLRWVVVLIQIRKIYIIR
jgi:hypothetical protein